jgi:hypothetical protein
MPIWGSLDPLTGAPMEVPEEASGKFGRITDALGQGLLNVLKFPGDYAKGGVLDTEAATQWAAPMALGMLGVGAPNAMTGAAGIGGGRLRLPMDDASRLARAQEQGFDITQPWYHGSWRTDRLTEGGKILPKRATSGPMPFFTDDPAMASGYAMGKKGDTSLIDNGLVQNYFTVSPKDMGFSGRADWPVERTWGVLPQEVKQTIAERAKRIGYENRDTGEGPIILHPEGVEATLNPQHYDWLLKNEERGNHLGALRNIWHDSGSLVGSESELQRIFELAGYPYPISQKNAPWTEARGVMPVYLQMRKPLVTHDEATMREVIPALEEAFKRDRTRLQQYGADMWDKNTRYTPRDWVQAVKDDYLKGENSFGWTSIPDKVTDQFRRLGFDSILDTGGKMGGASHNVAIPFSPGQVRSIWAKFDPKKAGSGVILGGGAGLTFGSLAPRSDQ